MADKRTAIALAGYNRPDYFRPTIRSLLSNAHIESCALWCFFDGGPGSRQREYQLILREELSSASHAPRDIQFAERSENLGCGRNLVDARRRLFDEEDYERVFVFEDDLIVSPHHLALSERLLDWAQARFTDIGVVQVYNSCWMTQDEKVCKLDEVTVGNPHWWGYLMPRETWSSIRPTLYEYEERFLKGRDYKHQDFARIREWAVAEIRAALAAADGPSNILRGERRFPESWDFVKYFAGTFATGQDSMTVLAMTLAGLQKLVTTVNRGQPIGVHGLHSTIEHFRRARLDAIELDVFESDATRCEFRVQSRDDSSLRPWMRADEVEAIRTVIRERQPRRVLEFGAGGSTVMLAREPGIQAWWSVEHSPEWVGKVSSALATSQELNVTLVFCPKDRILERVDQLLPIGFDMFFVDGFDRASLLDRLRRHLTTADGFVLLHDASRPDYRAAIERFPKRTILTEGDGKHQGLALLEVPK